MTICDLQRGDRAVVLKVELESSVRERLRALDLYTGATLSVLKVSLFKKTYLVEAKSAKVALGREIASGVRVWRA